MSRQLSNETVESTRQSNLISPKSVQKPKASSSFQSSQQKLGYKFGLTPVSKQTSSFDNEFEKDYYKKSNQNASKNHEAVEAVRVISDDEDRAISRHLETSTYLNINDGLVDGFKEPKILKDLQSMSISEQVCRKQLMQRHLSVIEAMEMLDLNEDSELLKQTMDQMFQQNIIRPSNEIDVWQINMSKAFIGHPAPAFKTDAVVDGDFKEVSLSDYKGKYVVLFFYPLDFTFVCPTEIIAFSEAADQFKKLGVEVLAASTDSKFSHLAWINQPRKHGGLGEMKIPVLADTNHSISRDYGVLKEDEGIAYRGLFIIDPKGILRQITINDLPVGRSVEETLRLVQAFQYTDKHGEVCPAGWHPGKDTIKPDVKQSKEYFGKH